MSALGRLVAAVALDTAEFTVGTDKAKYLAAQMAGEVDRTLKGLENSVKSTMGSIAAGLAAGFGIAALKNTFDSYAEGAAKLQDLAAKAGLTVEKMSGFVSVAKLSGTSADDLAGALAKLSRGVVNATGDTAGAGRALAFLGISATDSSGRLKDAGTLTEEVAGKLGTMADGAGKTAIAMDLYGKSGANLIPVLKDINEFGVKNATITAQQAAIAKEYEQDLVRLGMAKSALVKIISSELLPVGDAVVKTFLNMQTQAGGVRDKTQALAQDGSIRAFAMSAVNAFALVFNAGDSVIRIFEAAGEEIGYLVARTGNALSTIGHAVVDFIQGKYKQAWADVKDGATRDASIVVEHGDAMRAVFEKPLAGDKFVAGVEQNLASIDQKMRQHGETVRNTGDGYKKLATDTTAADDASKAILKSITDLIKAMDQLASLGKDYEISLRGQIEQHQFDLTLIGKTADEVQRLTAMRKLDLDLAKEVAKITADGAADMTLAQAAQLDNMIRLNAEAKARIQIILDTGAAMRAQQADFQAQVKDMDSAGTVVGKFFGSFATSGKSAIQIVRDEVKKLIADLIALAAKKIFLNFVANGTTGSFSSAASTAAANAGSNSIAGSALSWAGNITGASSLLGGAAAGFASGAAEVGAGAAFVGPSATLAGGAVGAGAEMGAAYAGLMETLAAIPIWGWIAAGVIAVAAWLGGRGKGGPKTGGSFMGAFDANGLIQNIAVPGTDNGRFFTPNQGDDVLKGLVTGTNTSYRATAASLGLNARNYTFGLGFDNDPNGTAQSRVSSSLLDSQGRTIYSQRDMNMDDKAVPAALQLESSRMILAAIKDSDLPAYLKKVFDGLTPSTATQEQINAAMQQGLALKSIFDVVTRNPMQDLASAMSASQNQLAFSMKNNETQIRSVMKAYDGTLATTQNLQTATVGYYNAQLQLIAGISQVKAGIDDMFGNSVRNFKMAGMDNQGKYNFLQQEAAGLQAQALASSDPETIRALSQRINDDMNAAFGLLSPEEQAAHSGEFATAAQKTQGLLDDRLEKIQKDAVDATQKILNDIKDLIGASDKNQLEAASTNLAAANTSLTAAQTPHTLVVRFDDTGQEVTTVV